MPLDGAPALWMMLDLGTSSRQDKIAPVVVSPVVQVEEPRWSWFTFLMSVCYSGIFAVVNWNHGELGERRQKGGARWTPKRRKAADERSTSGLSVSLYSEPNLKRAPCRYGPW